MPEKHHAVYYEKNCHPKGKVGKPDGWVCKIVDVEKAEEKKKYPRKVGDTMEATKAEVQDKVTSEANPQDNCEYNSPYLITVKTSTNQTTLMKRNAKNRSPL